MKRVDRIVTEHVEFVPESLKLGILYVSRRFSTASHLCCCGCGFEVVTPLNPARWRLTERAGASSLHPSVGNHSFPCRSHYWIEDGGVRWAGAMSTESIEAVRALDLRDAEALAQATEGRFAIFLRRLRELARKIGSLFRLR